MRGNVKPTIKFVNQLTRTERFIAADLVPCVNNSAVIIQGNRPGPIAKNKAYNNILKTLIYIVHS